jgi:Rod binding domain-containing protein
MITAPVGPHAAAERAPGSGRALETDWEFMLKAGRQPRDAEEQRGFLRYLCRQLEATAISSMLQAARRAAPQDQLFSGGFAGSMYQGLADEEYARLIASRGGFGVGDAVYRQVLTGLEAKRAYQQGAGAHPAGGIDAKGTPKGSDN